MAASLLIALTFLSVRLNIVVPGLAVLELRGLESAFADPRLSFSYFPSPTEWLLQLWIVSLGLLVFLAGRRWLPLVAKEVG